MMSIHGANPIFFNLKKKKDWTSRSLANPSTPTSDNISYLPYSHSLTKWTPYVHHPNETIRPPCNQIIRFF